MNTKLTLRLESALIKQAKHYASLHGTSVSQMVEDYFSLLSKEVSETRKKPLPLTQALRGVLKNSSIDEADYKAYLEKKHR